MNELLISLGKKAESRREEINSLRNLPDDLALELKQTGILRLWVAKAYGGMEKDLKSLPQAIQTLAYHEACTAWVATVTGTGSLISGYLQEHVGKELFGDSLAMLGGFASPVTRAKRVEGGIQLSGRWAWGSGTPHCSIIIGGTMVMEEGRDKPIPAVAMFDPKDVEWFDNWQVNGLQGTASGDYAVKDLFVPDGKWLPFPVTRSTVDSPLYKVSFLGALATGVASVGLGLAHRALDEIKLLGQSKKPSMTKRTLADRPVIQYQLGEIEARYLAAKALLDHAIDQNWETACKGESSVEDRAMLRKAASYAGQVATEVVDWAYKTGGGSSIWNQVKLQELQRDMQVVSQHALISPNMYEVLGKIAFGGKVNKWRL